MVENARQTGSARCLRVIVAVNERRRRNTAARIEREPRQAEHPAPPAPLDKRDQRGRDAWRLRRPAVLAGAGAVRRHLFQAQHALHRRRGACPRRSSRIPRSTPSTPRSSMMRSMTATAFFRRRRAVPDDRSRHRTRRRGPHLRRTVACGGRSGSRPSMRRWPRRSHVPRFTQACQRSAFQGMQRGCWRRSS